MLVYINGRGADNAVNIDDDDKKLLKLEIIDTFDLFPCWIGTIIKFIVVSV